MPKAMTLLELKKADSPSDVWMSLRGINSMLLGVLYVKPLPQKVANLNRQKERKIPANAPRQLYAAIPEGSAVIGDRKVILLLKVT